MIYLNFDSGTAGTTVGGFTQNGGANFQYRAGAGAILTTGGAGFTTPANDQSAVYNTGPSNVDSAAQVTQYMLYTSSGNWVGTGIVLNANAGLTTGYLFAVDLTSSGGNAIVYKNTGSGWNQVGATSASLGLTRADGTVYLIRAERVGSTLGMYVWEAGSSQPGTYTHSVTDGGTVLSAGYAGLRIGSPNASGYGQTLIDDFYVGIPSDVFTPVTGPTTCTITGPSAGRPGVASSNFTATLDQPATASTVVTFSDAADGGTFSGTVTIPIGSTSGTATYTAASVGAKTITATNDQGLTNVGTLTYTAYSLALSPGSQSVANNIAATLTATLTPSGALSATTTAGTLSTASPTSGSPFTLTTPSSGSGTATVTVTGLGGTSQTATVSYAPVAATALTLTGPSVVPVGSASSTFTIGANGNLASPVTVTVTVTPSGGTITSTPVTLSAGSGSTGTFTYTAATAGTFTVAITNGSGLTNPSSLTVTAAVVSTLTFGLLYATSGLVGTIGYTLYDNSTGLVYQARTTSGVAELGTSGQYRVLVSLPKTLDVWCVWDLAPGAVAKFAQQYPPRS